MTPAKSTSHTPLAVGIVAPSFTLSDREGIQHSLAKTAADFSVLFFYPRDSTPGCTLEAQGFTALLPQFARRNVAVFGLSGGTDKTKEKFCKKFDLSVTLLSDVEHSVATAFGVFGEKKFMGRTFLGIHRTTFVLDSRRRVVRVFESVKPEGHAEEVLAVIDELRAGTRPKRARPKAKASRRPRSAP